MFKTNEGTIDRALRIIVGLALLGAYFFMENASVWLLIGVVPLATGLLGWCPLYRVLGISTCPMKN